MAVVPGEKVCILDDMITTRQTLRKILSILALHRARVMTSLHTIFPVSLPPQPAYPSIAGLKLPDVEADTAVFGNSSQNSYSWSGLVDEEEISAALGLAALVIIRVADYCDVRFDDDVVIFRYLLDSH